MKVHQQNRKVSVVMDIEELMAIGLCLSESPNIKQRMLAVKLKEAIDEANKKAEKK